MVLDTTLNCLYLADIHYAVPPHCKSLALHRHHLFSSGIEANSISIDGTFLRN